MKSRKRTLAIAVCVAATLIVLVVIVAGYFGAQATSDLARAMELARRAGFSLSLSELQPEQVADEENGAVIYRAVFTELEERFEITEDRIFEHADEGDAAGPPRVTTFGRTTVAELADLLVQLHEASEKPRCVFQASWLDPPIAQVIRAGDLLAARAWLHHEAGDLERAVADLGALFTMSRVVIEKGFIIDGLVGQTVSAQGEWVLRNILMASMEPAALFARLSIPDVRGFWLKACRTESGSILDHYRRGELTEEEGMLRLPLAYHLPLLSDILVDFDVGLWLNWMVSLSETAGWGYPRTTRHLIGKIRDLPDRALLRFMTAGIVEYVKREAWYVSSGMITSLGVRYLGHRRDHGGWPGSLADLEGEPVPLDPVTGEAFIVTSSGRNVTLRSSAEEGPSWTLEP